METKTLIGWSKKEKYKYLILKMKHKNIQKREKTDQNMNYYNCCNHADFFHKYMSFVNIKFIYLLLIFLTNIVMITSYLNRAMMISYYHLYSAEFTMSIHQVFVIFLELLIIVNKHL